MAKLKPMKDAAEIAAVPTSEPVLVILDPTPTSSAGEQDDDIAQDIGEDQGVNILKEQLKAAQEATTAANAKADQERKDRLAAERREQEASQRVSVAETRTRDTEEQAISSGLAAAQAERDAARQAAKLAFEAGDSDKMADAQEKLGRASADIREFERAAAVLADRKEVDKTAPRQQQQFSSVEASIDAQAGLTDQERKWLKDHQDAWVDPTRNNELSVGYNRAMKQGLVRSTPEYFKFIEEFMGYSKPAQTVEDDDGEGTTIVAAPVSRETRSSTTNQANSNRVVLTPEQRDFARTMGLSDVQYAQQVLRMEREKKANPERYSSRG